MNPSYVWDEERSVLWDPFLCCLLSAMVRRSVRTWHHIQKEIVLFSISFWIPFPTPQSVGKRPLRKLKVPDCLALAKTSGIPAFRQHSPPPRPISSMMLGSRFMQKTDVSTEGTGQEMVHLAARWPKFSSLSQGQAVHKDDTVDSYCTASSSKEHAGTITQLTEMYASHLSRKKFQTFAAYSFSNVRIFCFSVFYKTVNLIFWVGQTKKSI